MNLEFTEIEAPQLEQVETPEAPKKKRGRPRKEAPAQPQPQQPQTKKPEATKPATGEIFDRIASEVKANEPQPDPLSPSTPTTVAVSPVSLIDGYLLLSFVDSIVPGLIKFLFKKKLANVKVENIALTEQQKNSLEPLADEIAKSVSGHINPIQAGLLAIGAIYYQNAVKYAGKV